YEPIKVINVKGKNIYVYKIYEVNIDWRMDYWAMFFFDFDIGMIYRWSYEEEWLLEGYENVELLK
ncbi:MAG: hypothetical protein GXO49_08465, partial [Chlorobi bacterium]|nr:hypothetical protein [Chlorobiota bacterium]